MLDRLALPALPVLPGRSHPARLHRVPRRWPLAPSRRSRGRGQLRLVPPTGI